VTIVQKPTYRDERNRLCVPVAQSILLTFQQTYSAGNYAFRNRLSVGSGGQRTTVLIDALNTQQVSVAGEDLQVDLLCEKVNPAFPFTPPTVDVTATANFADGNVTSGQATYTQSFQINAGQNVTLPKPPMATSFKLMGLPIGAAQTPFVAGLQLSDMGSQAVVGWIGTDFTNNGPFVQLSGLAQGILLNNGSALGCTGVILWGLDL
jgi:hypothetical protein